MEDSFFLISAIVFGLIIGSFLSVCIYRIPIGKGWDEEDLSLSPGSLPETEKVKSEPKPQNVGAQSFSSPKRSLCPKCGKQLLWWHNIPLISWFLLGGKCGFCKAAIPFRYPLVEMLSALAAAMSYINFGPTATAFIVFAFCAALIVISVIDYDYYIIPNVISLPGTVIGVALAGINNYFHIFTFPLCATLLDSVFGILAGGGFLYLVSEGYFRLRKKEGLGMGDVKLLAMTGAFFGPEGSIYTIFVGSLLGSVLGILLILLSGRKFSHQLPFGPYLALGTTLYLFMGTEVLNRFGESLGILFK